MSRGRPRSLLCILVLAAACGENAPIGGESLTITAGIREIELGRAFPLTVVRTWRRGESGGEWKDETLAPLRIRTVGISRREDGRRVEETRRYQAYAFLPGDRMQPVELRVTPVLDPAAPGPAELPDVPDAEQFPWWLPGAAAAAAALFLALGRRRRPSASLQSRPSEPTAPAARPEVRALERLVRLRATTTATGREVEAYYVEASGLLRDYIAERFEIATREKSTEQILAALPRSEPADRALLHCDLVKFARYAPSAAERESLLDSAERFVRETA